MGYCLKITGAGPNFLVVLAYWALSGKVSPFWLYAAEYLKLLTAFQTFVVTYYYDVYYHATKFKAIENPSFNGLSFNFLQYFFYSDKSSNVDVF